MLKLVCKEIPNFYNMFFNYFLYHVFQILLILRLKKKTQQLYNTQNKLIEYETLYPSAFAYGSSPSTHKGIELYMYISFIWNRINHSRVDKQWENKLIRHRT